MKWGNVVQVYIDYQKFNRCLDNVNATIKSFISFNPSNTNLNLMRPYRELKFRMMFVFYTKMFVEKGVVEPIPSRSLNKY